MKFKNFNICILSRLLICFLCCIILFSLVSKPITASASATATVTIGTTLGEVAVVAPELLPICLLLVACGWWNSTTTCQKLIAKAEEVGSLGNLIRSWSAEIAPQIIDGTSVFKIPTEVANDFNKQMDKDANPKKLPSGLPYLLIPASFLALNNLSQNELLAQDISGILTENNELAQQSNRLLLYIGGAINDMSLSLSNSLQTITSSFKSEFSKLKEWYSTINENMKEEARQVKVKLTTINENVKEEFRQVKVKLTTINENVKEEFRQVKNKLTTINENLKEEIIQVRTKLTTINENLKSYINDLISSFETGVLRIEAKIDSIVKADSDFAQPPAPGNDGNTGNTVQQGVNTGLGWFGSSNGILAEYATAFLVATMIFNLFANIAIFNKLLIVSASIGLVGVFLGLVFNAAQADSAARKEAEREAKRDAYRQSRYKSKGG